MAPRLTLAPGLRVLSRGQHEVQIGLGPRHRLRLPLDAGLRRVLKALDRGESTPTDLLSRRAVDKLRPLLLDADQLAPPQVAPGDAAAAALREPAGFGARLAARARITVAVDDRLGAGGDAERLLAAAGLRLGSADDPDAVMLLLAAGEPDRALLDPLVRDGRTHQLVRAVEGEFVVGPLVVPGRTACLRCLDAHHSGDDPLHPVLVGTHHRALRHDGVAEPLDSALLCLALGWAVRDLVAHLDGEAAVSWSASVRVGADLGALSVVSWLRHPGCGCAWTPREDQSDRMGA